MPVTRSQSAVKENTEPPNSRSLKTSHASVGLFTPRIMNRSKALQNDEVPMEIDDEDQPRKQMLLRCSGKPMDDKVCTPPPKRSSFAYSPSHNFNERPLLPGIEFSSKPASPDCQTPPRSTSRQRRDLRSRFHCIGEDEENKTEELGRIMVYVRLRPLSRREKEAGARSSVRVVDKTDIFLTEMLLETDYLRLKRVRGRHFVFDAVFHESTGQQEVYNTTTAGLVEAVLEGRNASVFCYGATGAGKTYTMLGTVTNPGVMVLALKDLFNKLKDRSKDAGDYVVTLSYLEVYNEMVKDLISPGRPLVIREDNNKGIITTGLTHYKASSAEEVMLLLQKGNQNRTTEPTRINETSSRSHAILQVTAEYKVRMETSTITRSGKLSLIDLAGSERALATDQRSQRSLEGANINKSLLALSRCIKALVEGDKHVPFRNSKLTQLLKDSLGGTCQTAMIANITPSNECFGETQNTLHWADKAKEIRTKVSVKEEIQIPESQEDQTKLLLEMQKENQQLRFQLAKLQQKYITLQCTTTTTSNNTDSTFLLSPSRKNPFASPPATRSKPASPLQNRDSETIKELKKLVQMMEKDAQKMQRDHQKREGELTNTIAGLTLQIKQKDEMIKKLSQQKPSDQAKCTVPTRSAASSPKPQPQTALPPSGRPAPYTTEQKMKVMRKPRLSFSTPVVPEPPANPNPPTNTPANQPHNPSSRFCSPAKVDATAASKKRSFWDLGSSNSPSIAERLRSCARTNTPSLLLQPGFIRRRQSEEQ